MILIVNAHFVWILRKKLPLWNPARCGIQGAGGRARGRPRAVGARETDRDEGA
jgi:hypothetical protein